MFNVMMRPNFTSLSSYKILVGLSLFFWKESSSMSCCVCREAFFYFICSSFLSAAHLSASLFFDLYFFMNYIAVGQTVRTCFNARYLLPTKPVVFIYRQLCLLLFLELHWQPSFSLKGFLQVCFLDCHPCLLSWLCDYLRLSLMSCNSQLTFLSDEQTTFSTHPLLTSVTVSGFYIFPEYIVR